DRERDADIGEQADAADQIEQQQAAQDANTLQPLVAVGQEIVEDEVAGHRHDRTGGLGLREWRLEQFQRDEQHREMHQQAEPADRGEQDEAQRDQVVGQFRQHEAEEVERNHRVELALAMLAGAESVGNLDGAQLALRRRDDVEQDLEALGRELRRELLEAVPADHEEAAHGIGDLDLQRAARDLGGEGAGAGALLVEAVGLVALDVAAADHE
ncbi:hypothetical protein chiPu_0031656, partial [Chiloscyllium punctatum]|nr:hypothetical protein [Chiloscyllium punctatum]